MAMRASKLDAYRNLIEQVYGQNINSTTTVEDMVVSSDTFKGPCTRSYLWGTLSKHFTGWG